VVAEDELRIWESTVASIAAGVWRLELELEVIGPSVHSRSGGAALEGAAEREKRTGLATDLMRTAESVCKL
jgi:hypothetical protein